MIYAIIATIGVAAAATFISIVIYKAMLDVFYFYILDKPYPMNKLQRTMMLAFATIIGIGMGTILYVLGSGYTVPICRFFLQMVS